MKKYTSFTQLARTTIQSNNSNKRFLFALLFGSTLLSACNSTPPQSLVPIVETVVIERMSTDCINSVSTQQAMLENGNPAQYLSLANAAQHCVGEIAFSPSHPDSQTAMKFSALAIINYIKAGDIATAAQGLSKFRASFPQQDLLFVDYSSFVDTATALVKQSELSVQQLTLLNINQHLRDELTRQRRWSL